MKLRKTNHSSVLKRILILTLCLIMLAGTVLAENINVDEFCTGDGDYLYFLCTLSDGRLLCGGSKTLDESKDIARKWLLCLNPDRSVSWEYITPEEEASTVMRASERPDGTIAVVFDMGDEDYEAPEGARSKIRYYTPDGQPTGKETDLPGVIMSITDTDIVQMLLPEEENDDYRYILTDWEGNVMDESDELQTFIHSR